MSAFRDLLIEAHAKGVRFLTFDVDLKDFFASDDNEAWRVEHDNAGASGRTGEEALRRLVEKL